MDFTWMNEPPGPSYDSVYSGSEHRQFNSPRLVKHEAGLPDPRRVLIGSNQLWRVNDSPYYRDFCWYAGYDVIGYVTRIAKWNHSIFSWISFFYYLMIKNVPLEMTMGNYNYENLLDENISMDISASKFCQKHHQIWLPSYVTIRFLRR